MNIDNKGTIGLKTHRTQPNPPSIIIFPPQVQFEDVTSNNCYEIALYLRNESKQTQKIRLIPPASRYFRIKTKQGLLRNIAPGLSVKLLVLFCLEKTGQEKLLFEDKLQIIGDAFKETVNLKAFTPHENFAIPTTFSFGRLLAGRQNICVFPIKNEGKKTGQICCQLPSNSINTLVNNHLNLSAGEIGKIELNIRNKKTGPYEQKLSFSNGSTCILQAVFIEQSVEIFSAKGKQLTLIDLGQIFIGEKVQQKFYLLNNTDSRVDCIFKTFNCNLKSSDVKVDFAHGNFVIKTPPEDYAKQLSNCYSFTTIQKATVQAYSELQNSVVISKEPTLKQVKAFHSYASGLSLEQIHEQPIIETLMLSISNTKNSQKIPIKFMPVFPRLLINTTVLEYGEVRERTDVIKEVSLRNEGDRDIQIRTEPTENVKVQGPSIIRAHHNETFTVNLRAVKIGKINESVHFWIFEGLQLEVKIFGVCKGASIRAKKIINMNSARELRRGLDLPLSETLTSLSPSNCNSTRRSDVLNCTDTLVQLRATRRHKLLQQQINSQAEPILPEPRLTLMPQDFGSKAKRQHSLRKLTRLGVFHLNSKQIDKIYRALSITSLGNIVVNASGIAFGNVFIDTQVVKEVKVTNKNEESILFEWDTGGNQTLKSTICALSKIEGSTTKTFKIVFRPNILGEMVLPLGYVINRHHTFELSITAFITPIKAQLSDRSIQTGFSSNGTTFEKQQFLEVQQK